MGATTRGGIVISRLCSLKEEINQTDKRLQASGQVSHDDALGMLDGGVFGSLSSSSSGTDLDNPENLGTHL